MTWVCEDMNFEDDKKEFKTKEQAISYAQMSYGFRIIKKED